MKFVIIIAVLAEIVFAKEKAHQPTRQFFIQGIAKILDGLMNGFGKVNDENCDFFPGIKEFSDEDPSDGMYLISNYIKRFTCDSEFTNEFAKEVIDDYAQPLSCVNEYDEVVNPTTTPKVLYVVDADNHIQTFDWSKDAKNFVLRDTLDYSGYTICLATDATRKHLVSMLTFQSEIEVFNFNSSKNVPLLRKINKVESNILDYATFDSTNKYLLASNTKGGSVISYELLADGTLTKKDSYNPGLGNLGANLNKLVFHPKAKGVIAENYQELDKIIFLKFDSTNGTITKIPIEYKMPDATQPHRLVFSKDGKYMYVACYSNQLYTFRITVNKATDVVTDIKYKSKISTVEKQDTALNSPEIAYHPSGKFLYALVQGLNNIAMYTIDKTNGKLSSNGFQPTGVSGFPLSVSISTDGSLLVFGFYLGGLHVYEINQDSGKLTFLLADQNEKIDKILFA